MNNTRDAIPPFGAATGSLLALETPRTEKELLSSDCSFNCGHYFKYLRDEKHIDGKCVETGPDIAHGNDGLVVLSDFARQLERENTRLREALEDLIAQCKTGDDITAWWKAAVERAESALANK